jgi:predicted DNA-binding transcriptional regulator YafY
MAMDQMYRQWLILKMISRRKLISVDEIRNRLAKESDLDAPPRTVQRDLNSLSRLFPLKSDGKKPSGWKWNEDSGACEVPNMDQVTALTFKLAAEYVAKMLPRGVLDAFGPYVRTAEERLNQAATPKFMKWPDKVRVVSPNLFRIPPDVPEGIVETVYTALLECRRFAAGYRRMDGEQKTYEVSPLGMAFVDGLTYLVATLNDHDDPILLLLHRILEAHLLDIPACTPEGFDLDGYIARELSFPVGRDIKLKALFSEKSDVMRLRESPVAEDQQVRELRDGRFELNATVTDSIQVRWWLRGYGDRIEVLKPKRLRDEFAEIARNLSGIYLKPE